MAPALSAVPLSVDALFQQTVCQGEGEPALPVLVQTAELVWGRLVVVLVAPALMGSAEQKR